MVSYKQEKVVDYIQTYSGRKFYILDPEPDMITIEDIAHALSNICRFTGHSDRFYSVAEHSIHCAKIARKSGYSTLIQLYALGHDASEAIVNDLNRPTKQNIPQYKEIEDKIMSVMWKVMNLPEPTSEIYNIIKCIDNTMLIHEMQQVMNRSVDDYPEVETVPIYIDLSVGYNAGESKKDFLDLYHSLTNEHILLPNIVAE